MLIDLLLVQQKHLYQIENMWVDFERMSYSNKLKFLLSGLNCDRYMPEWRDVYLRVSDLIFVLNLKCA